MAAAFATALLIADDDGWIEDPGKPSGDVCPAPGGKWISRGQIASGTGANTGSKVRFADIDGDGKDDYLVVNDDGSVDAWRNTGGDHDGQAGWVAMGRIAADTGSGPSDVITFADIDGDGRDDYLVIGSNGQVNAWLNDGGDQDGRAGWISRGQIAAGVGDQAEGTVVFADINGDDRDDYLVVGRNHEVTEWENDGGDQDGRAGWIPRGQIASGVGTSNDTVLFADVTCDKQDDYLLLGTSGELTAWRNLGGDQDGKEGWVGIGRIASGTPADGAVQLANINGDGLDDYLVVDQNGAVQAWTNNGGDPT
ncbi:FG-GAP repeat domain-containing protein [Streptomyces sp. GQFP]|uniref:FG-GAP repeat domain-containing protein n=1 Tax=Streptomyces sp. GQFP TaxID=2907545 RepID=UPI001F43F9C8|nr:VCBS repeat-containing protein [Streptomyces sp. GQFP]UIX33315.1 VCBS repeat-containing protein [Streptomyces sp. GQFP]